MAETVDLEGWELLSHSSSSREEFEEDGFAYFDYLSKDLERKGEVFNSEEVVQFNSNEILGTHQKEISGCDENLGSRQDGCDELHDGEVINSEKKYSDLDGGFDEKDKNFNKGMPIGESSVHGDLDMEDSIEELGFGETEVLGAFCLSEINYEKNSLKLAKDLGEKDEQFHLKTKISALAFQQFDNFNLDSSNCKEGETSLEKSENSDDNVNSENLGIEENKENGGAKREKKHLIWWKIPIDVMKYYLFGIKPVWSVSLAMGFFGFLMISRKLYLYKMKKQQDKSIPPMKIHFDEKKRRQIRISKGLTMVRPEPIIRTSFPGFGVTLFPAMSTFQWAP